MIGARIFKREYTVRSVFLFLTLAASSEKRNVTVWRPSVCLPVRRHTHRDSPGGGMQRDQSIFRPDNSEDRHTVVLVGCQNRANRIQFACEGKELYISCGQSVIHVLDANYGRLDNSVCANQLGTANDNCRFDASCIVSKWSSFFSLSACMRCGLLLQTE